MFILLQNVYSRLVIKVFPFVPFFTSLARGRGRCLVYLFFQEDDVTSRVIIPAVELVDISSGMAKIPNDFRVLFSATKHQSNI